MFDGSLQRLSGNAGGLAYVSNSQVNCQVRGSLQSAKKHFECGRSIEIDDFINAKLDCPWTEFLVLRIEVWVEEGATGVNTV